MLHEKLNVANKRTSLLLAATASIIVAAVAALALVILFLGRDHVVTELSASNTPSEVASGGGEGDSLTLGGKSEVPKVGRVLADELRKNFRKALSQFETELEATIDSEAFKRWDSEAQHQILELKRSGVREYTNGNYIGAQKNISGAIDIAKSKIERRQKQFEGLIKKSAERLRQDDYNNSLINANAALRIFEAHPEALDLRKKIEQLPPILEKLEMAAVARAEGSISREYEALSGVLALDPKRQTVAARLGELERAVREQNFSRAIQAGLNNVAERNHKSAVGQLTTAKGIFPSREETRLLAERVAELGRELKGLALIGQAEAAAGGDNWQAALSAFQAASKFVPDNQKVAAGKSMAIRILAASEKVERTLATSHRLSSPNVARAARDFAEGAREIELLSSTLKSRLEELRNLLRLYAEEVPIRVQSDGQANVSVKGVGRVGAVTEKTIKLKPGGYTFECTRPGFRSKLMKVEVPPGATEKSIHITCDEPV